MTEKEMLPGLLDALVTVVRSGTEPTPRAELLDVVAIVEAATPSRGLGRPVDLPL